MSNALNDNEVFQRKTPLSMKELNANRKSFYTKSVYGRGGSSSRVRAVKSLDELVGRLPEVQTEADVDDAADYLVEVFQAPKSKAFYCDVVRHIRDREFLQRAIKTSFGFKVKNPAAYFGRICTNRLMKLGRYK